MEIRMLFRVGRAAGGDAPVRRQSLSHFRRILCAAVLIAAPLSLPAADSTDAPTSPPAGRGQWSLAEAWAWNSKVGVIRGFNALGRAYPGMSEQDVMRKASSLGYNSIRTGDFFKKWLQSPALAKKRLHQLLDEAQANGLTVAPVMLWGDDSVPGGHQALQDRNNPVWTKLRAYVQDMVGEFRNDDRIVLWDLFNEPGFTQGEDTDLQATKQLILWAREVNPRQPLTSSIACIGTTLSPERAAVEQLADIHNFHLYDISSNQMNGIAEMIASLKKVSDRPIVCTECLARTRGDTFGRILSAFSKYHVDWYNWGLYTSDENWSVSWHRSTFDPHSPWFHDVLQPDGDPYDWRDLELIRNFHFAVPGETPDPGVEVTDRWLKERAWQWFFQGPLRGLTYRPGGTDSWTAMWRTDVAQSSTVANDLTRLQRAGFDSLRVRLDYTDWKANPDQFLHRVGDFLALADRHGMTVTPVLLTDADARFPAENLEEYVRSLVKTFGRDGRIFCWELYFQPGASGLPQDQARALLQGVFRTARFEFPGQPLTATPAVRVREFQPNFDYRRALAHQGGLGSHGWDMLQHLGTSNAAFCAYVWSLSDILAVPSEEAAPETGWLLSIAGRYDRPVLCSQWMPRDEATLRDTLALFSERDVRWYGCEKNLISSEPAVLTPSEAAQTGTRRESPGLFDPSALSAEDDVSRQLRNFRYVRVMTPRE